MVSEDRVPGRGSREGQRVGDPDNPVLGTPLRKKERSWQRVSRPARRAQSQGRNGKAERERERRNGGVDEATLRELLAALRAASGGDFDFRLNEGQGGLGGELAKAYNDLAERRWNLADELRASRASSATPA